MTLQERITVSSEDIMLKLEQALDRFRHFQYDSKYKELLGNVFLKKVETWDTKIRARKNDPFTIVVVGEFKRGKSSFINALLGEEILCTDVTPETVTMNRLVYGVHKNEAVLSGGRRMELTDGELKRGALEKLIADVGEPIRQLELSRPNEWLKDIRIIDTPGMNDILCNFDSIVAEALSQADAVIYIYSVNMPLSRSEQMYLRYSILPQRYTKLFLIGNYADLLETQESFSRMRLFLQKRISELLPKERIYMVSALDELCRSKENERPCAELSETLESEFSLLRRELEELIKEKKTVIASDRMLRMTRLMAEELCDSLNNIEKGLEMSSSQLALEQEMIKTQKDNQVKQLQEAKEQIHDKTTVMNAEALQWLSEIQREIEGEDLSVYSAQEILQYYSYYCIELLQTAVHECLEYHREELLDQMSLLSGALGKNLAGTYTGKDKLSFCLRLDNNTWTRGDSVTLTITQLSSNSLLNAIVNLTGSLLRKGEIEADKGKLIEDIRKKYPQLWKEVKNKVTDQYSALACTADKLLEEYYEEQIKQAEAAVEQYKEAAQKSDKDKQAVAKAVEEIRETLNVFLEKTV